MKPHDEGMSFEDMIVEALTCSGWESAEIILRIEIKENSANHLAHYLLGVLLSNKGDHDEAVKSVSEAVMLDPDNRHYGEMLAELIKPSAVDDRKHGKRKKSSRATT